MLNRWEEFDHARVPIVNARVKDIVRRAYGKTLEVGCNEGFVAKALMEKGLDVTAVDNSDFAIISAKHHFGIDAIKCNAEKMPFKDGEFDTVVGGEILEHTENPGLALAEMFRVSKGHVIITLPIGDYWLGELTHLWGLDGGVLEHEAGHLMEFQKHAFIIEFDRRREKYHDAINKKIDY